MLLRNSASSFQTSAEVFVSSCLIQVRTTNTSQIGQVQRMNTSQDPSMRHSINERARNLMHPLEFLRVVTSREILAKSISVHIKIVRNRIQNLRGSWNMKEATLARFVRMHYTPTGNTRLDHPVSLLAAFRMSQMREIVPSREPSPGALQNTSTCRRQTICLHL